MALTSPRFAGSERLQRAADNTPPLKRPESGDAVKRLQQALADLGYKMPASFAGGGPDGVYGAETERVVRQFQMDQKFSVSGRDGRAGAKPWDGWTDSLPHQCRRRGPSSARYSLRAASTGPSIRPG